MGELRYFARRALLLFVLAVIGLPAAAQDAARASTPMNRRLLDLRAPPLNHVLSAAQIEAFTAASDDAPLESVIVEGSRTTPACCGLFIAVPWALMHPHHFWQIFTPVVGTCPGTWCTDDGH